MMTQQELGFDFWEKVCMAYLESGEFLPEENWFNFDWRKIFLWAHESGYFKWESTEKSQHIWESFLRYRSTVACEASEGMLRAFRRMREELLERGEDTSVADENIAELEEIFRKEAF